jgi:DNA-binding helix-hairpin-helix protein with protein kinase domain
MLPPPIQQAFLEAFESSSRQEGMRPSAQSWADLLVNLEHDLIRCQASPAHCHWKGAMECPWCTIFKQTGTDLFPRASHDLLSSVKDPVAEVLKNLQPFAFQVTTETSAGTHVLVQPPSVSTTLAEKLAEGGDAETTGSDQGH